MIETDNKIDQNFSPIQDRMFPHNGGCKCSAIPFLVHSGKLGGPGYVPCSEKLKNISKLEDVRWRSRHGQR